MITAVVPLCSLFKTRRTYPYILLLLHLSRFPNPSLGQSTNAQPSDSQFNLSYAMLFREQAREIKTRELIRMCSTKNDYRVLFHLPNTLFSQLGKLYGFERTNLAIVAQ